MPISSADDFHSVLHGSVGTPQPGVRITTRHKRRIRTTYDRVHTSAWATSTISLKAKTITVDVYIDFQKNSLSATDYTKLQNLAKKGIERYWSRSITLSGESYTVNVIVHHRTTDSIEVDLYIETSSDYARSHNSGIIDASFIYNQGVFKGSPTQADNDFMLVSAHEFGHSVLEYFGGTYLSWSHKESTNALLQNVKSSTPGYPTSGEIDLMKYYDRAKMNVRRSDLFTRSIADETDVKRLIWISKANIT